MADTQVRDEPAVSSRPDDKHEPPITDAVDPEPLANQPHGQYDQVTGIKLFFLLLSLALACFLILLDTSVVSTAVPKITDDFHSLKDVGWYASSYQLGSVVLQLMTGKIYLHFSLKWSFIVFFFIFELGSALSGAAQSSAMLIISRAVSGIGASGLINGAITILSASVPLERRPRTSFLVLAALVCPFFDYPFLFFFFPRFARFSFPSSSPLHSSLCSKPLFVLLLFSRSQILSFLLLSLASPATLLTFTSSHRCHPGW
jgi:MFS family permease